MLQNKRLQNNSKVIALDLDGTTLNNDGIIPDYTKLVLKRLQDVGYRVIIVTGRPNLQSEYIHRDLGLNTPLITFNGAVAQHPLNIKHELPIDLPKKIYNLKDKLKIKTMIVQYIDTFFTTSPSLTTPDYLGKNTKDELKPHLLVKSSIRSHEGSQMILLETNYPTGLSVIKALDSVFKELNIQDTVVARPWYVNKGVAEINVSGLSKATALKQYLEQNNLSTDNVYAFGDSFNDTEMLELAGHSYITANSHLNIKGVIRLPYTNDQQGVAKALNLLFPIQPDFSYRLPHPDTSRGTEQKQTTNGLKAKQCTFTLSTTPDKLINFEVREKLKRDNYCLNHQHIRMVYDLPDMDYSIPHSKEELIEISKQYEINPDDPLTFEAIRLGLQGYKNGQPVYLYLVTGGLQLHTLTDMYNEIL